jgi:cytochrome P450
VTGQPYQDKGEKSMLTSAHGARILAGPPGPPAIKGWPVAGAVPHLLRDPLGFLTQARATYGDIYRLNLGFTDMVVLNHPRHAQHVLRDSARKYGKGGEILEFARTFLGNGVFLSEGDFWLRQRRIMQPQFHRQQLAALTAMMVKTIDEVLASWAPAATTGKPFVMLPALSQLTMRTAVTTMFGAAVTEQEIDRIAKELQFMLGYILLGAVTQHLPAWLPAPGRRRYQQTLANYDQLIYRIIAEGRQQQAQAQQGNQLLALLLNAVDEETGESMTDRQLRDEVATLFLAGYETTSLALSWTIELLAHHPDVLARLQAEIDQVLGGRLPAFADLMQLSYTRMVLQEALRLRPPAFWTVRKAVVDDEIDGYTIPAGSEIALMIYMIHHHPEFWANPLHFAPERFAPDQAAGGARHPFAWIPFGAGPRLCIGRDFALLEGALALAMMMQRYTIHALPGRQAQPVPSTTLRPKGGVVVRLEPRV